MRSILNKIGGIITDRPLASACALLMLLTALFFDLPTTIKLCGAVFFLILFILFVVLRRKYARKALFTRAAVCCALTFTCLVTTFLSYDLFNRRLENAGKENATVDLRLYLTESVYEGGYYSSYIARVTEIDGKSVANVKTLVRFENVRAELFKELAGSCRISAIQSDDAGFDSSAYYRSNGVYSQIEEGNALVYDGSDAGAFFKPLYYLRLALKNRIDSFTTGDTAGLLKALLLGDKTELSASVKKDFRTLGVSHLLAVSGMHLSILFFLFSALLKKLRIPMKPRSVVLIVLIFLYAGLCGFSMSVLRAAVMLFFLLLSKIRNEKSDGFTSLFLSGALIVLFSPVSIFNISFLLSFFATLGILVYSNLQVFSQGGRPLRRAARRLVSSLLVSLSAQAAVLPVTVFSSGSVTLLSPVSTLVFFLPIAAVLYLAPFCLLLSLVPFLSVPASLAVGLPCKAILTLCPAARYVRSFCVQTPKNLYIPFLAVTGVLAVLLLLSENKRRCLYSIIGCFIVYAGVCAILPFSESARMIAAPVKNGDIMLLYAHGESALVDISDGSKKFSDSAYSLLKFETPELSFDNVVYTHYHVKHLQSLSALLEKNYIDCVYLPEPRDEEQDIFDALCDIARSGGAQTVVYTPSDDFDVCGITLFGADRQLLKRSTHPTLTLSFGKNGKVVVYCSRSYWEIGSSPPDCDVLLFGEHGPVIKSAPEDDFLPDAPLLCFSEETARNIGKAASAETPEIPYVFYFE